MHVPPCPPNRHQGRSDAGPPHRVRDPLGVPWSEARKSVEQRLNSATGNASRQLPDCRLAFRGDATTLGSAPRRLPRFNEQVSDELEPQRSPRLPLKKLKKWPTVHRTDQACAISGVTYPAPNALGAEEVEWWLDFLQMRISASRSLSSNIVAGLLGAMFAVVIASVTVGVTTSLWQAWLSAIVSLGLVAGMGYYFANDSDHSALEHRWMLYRQRARELAQEERNEPG